MRIHTRPWRFICRVMRAARGLDLAGGHPFGRPQPSAPSDRRSGPMPPLGDAMDPALVLFSELRPLRLTASVLLPSVADQRRGRGVAAGPAIPGGGGRAPDGSCSMISPLKIHTFTPHDPIGGLGLRMSRSRYRRAACAAARDPRGTIPSGQSRPRPDGRPALTRMPCLRPSAWRSAPTRFIARRKLTRRSSCWAIDLGDQLRVKLWLADLDDVEMQLAVGHRRQAFWRSTSISAPFLPMITPGRAVWIVTRHLRCGRSMMIAR
jgi:hypothetical protein